MDFTNILSLLGGVALFLFGMTLMGDGLKKVAGNRLELVLYRLSGTTLKGLLLGTGVTAVIQSSSATSVMVVGFVNSGMMRLKQAISVILGSIVGTSITGWIICLSSIEGSGWVSMFSTSTISAVVAIVGIMFRMISKKQANRHIGDILLGFAVLMFGMQSMSSAVAPLRGNETFIRVFTTFSNPVLGILAGIIFTSILQSASASVGILQALSMTGVVTFSTAFPLILGMAIGAAVPVLLSALGAKADGRRAAAAYLIITVIGTVICGAAFYILNGFLHFPIMDMEMNQVSVALLNTVFRAVTAIILLPVLAQLEKLVISLIHESEEEKTANAEFDRLDERFLKYPSVAVEQSRMTVNAMARAAKENLLTAINLIKDYNDERAKKVAAAEDLVDRFEDRLGSYLMKITGREMTRKQNESVSKYLHTLSDFERISDHAMNIAEAAEEIYTKRVRFSDAAQHELDVLTAAIKEILALAIESFIDEDTERAYMVEPLEEHIDYLCDAMKMHHVERLQSGNCSLSQGFVFNDILTNFERVADHCSNLAIALIELQTDSYDTHGYVINLKELRSHNFDFYYEYFTDKYKI